MSHNFTHKNISTPDPFTLWGKLCISDKHNLSTKLYNLCFCKKSMFHVNTFWVETHFHNDNDKLQVNMKYA